MARKKPPEQVSGQYGAVPHAVLDSTAYIGASYPAKALLVELMRQLTGSNNGHLQLATSWLKTRGWTSHDVPQRAKLELIDRRLIVKTRLGGLNSGPDLWAVTWLSISDYFGLDLRAGDYQPGAWRQFTPSEKQKKRTVCRDGAIPLDGTERPLTIPANGTKTALFDASAIPLAGNNVNTHVPLRSTTKRIVGQPGKTGKPIKQPASIQPH